MGESDVLQLGWSPWFCSPERGFLVPMAVALWFGVGPVTDAWYWALALPTFALVLAGFELATTATPVLARLRSAEPARVQSVLGALLTWSVLGVLLAGTLPRCCGGADSCPLSRTSIPATVALARQLLWELLPAMGLVAAGAGLRSACEVQIGNFRAVALGPLVRAGVIIGSTWVLLVPLGPHALPAGLAAGEGAQVLAWAFALWVKARIRPQEAFACHPRCAGSDVIVPSSAGRSWWR